MVRYKRKCASKFNITDCTSVPRNASKVKCSWNHNQSNLSVFCFVLFFLSFFYFQIAFSNFISGQTFTVYHSNQVNVVADEPTKPIPQNCRELTVLSRAKKAESKSVRKREKYLCRKRLCTFSILWTSQCECARACANSSDFCAQISIGGLSIFHQFCCERLLNQRSIDNGTHSKGSAKRSGTKIILAYASSNTRRWYRH